MNALGPPKPPTPPGPPTEVLGTPAPSKLPWWRRGWGVATIGVVCLLVGIGIGGASSSSTKSKSPAPTPAQLLARAEATKARVHREGVEKAANERTRVANEKKEAREKAAEARAAAHRAREEAAEKHQEEQKEREEAARKKAEETKTYSGTGGENIGTIHVTAASLLHWECACTSDNFQIFNSAKDEHNITVNTINQTSGKTHLEEGTYHEVLVNTEGESWTIHIMPDE
jgi:hypothetical protein